MAAGQQWGSSSGNPSRRRASRFTSARLSSASTIASRCESGMALERPLPLALSFLVPPALLMPAVPPP
jgi:hypothetical protein